MKKLTCLILVIFFSIGLQFQNQGFVCPERVKLMLWGKRVQEGQEKVALQAKDLREDAESENVKALLAKMNPDKTGYITYENSIENFIDNDLKSIADAREKNLLDASECDIFRHRDFLGILARKSRDTQYPYSSDSNHNIISLLVDVSGYYAKFFNEYCTNDKRKLYQKAGFDIDGCLLELRIALSNEMRPKLIESNKEYVSGFSFELAHKINYLQFAEEEIQMFDTNNKWLPLWKKYVPSELSLIDDVWKSHNSVYVVTHIFNEILLDPLHEHIQNKRAMRVFIRVADRRFNKKICSDIYKTIYAFLIKKDVVFDPATLSRCPVVYIFPGYF